MNYSKDTLPKLMPFQEDAFNADTYVQAEFLKLKEQFNITHAIETGSCLYSTTMWLADNFEQVHTVEVNERYYDLGRERAKGYGNINGYLGDTTKHLPKMLNDCEGTPIVFLDAHWGDYCPLLDELRIIKESGVKPVIAIHDFKVPNKPFNFDTYKGQPLEWDWIKEIVNEIYKGDFEYYYNEKTTEVNRGLVYILPKF